MTVIRDWWRKPVEYTAEDMAVWRELNPDSASYPDEVEASTMLFAWFVLGRRFSDVWHAFKHEIGRGT